MGFLFTFACLAFTLSFSVIGKSTTQTTVDSIYKPLQVTRAQLMQRVAAKSKPHPSDTGIFMPTPVIAQTAPQGSERLHRRWGNPSEIPSQGNPSSYNVKRSRVHQLFLRLFDAIHPHAQKIRNLCHKHVTGKNAEELAWNLLAELQAILTLLLDCVKEIKNCGNAPTPSGVPTGNGPTLADICHIIFKIMQEMRECFQLIRSLCEKYVIIRKVCSDTMHQISESLSTLISKSGSQVGDISTGLSQLFGAIPNYFKNVGFGFYEISRILKT